MEPVTKNIPALALRGLVVYPRLTAAFDLERLISMRALERAMESDQELFVVTQRELNVDVPQQGDLYTVGTLVHISQVLRVSDHVIRVIVEGKQRARLRRLWQREPFLQAQIELIDEPEPVRPGTRTEALLRQTYANFGEYVELTQNLTAEILAEVFTSTEPGYLADFIAQHVNIRYQDKQIIWKNCAGCCACAVSTRSCAGRARSSRSNRRSRARCASGWAASTATLSCASRSRCCKTSWGTPTAKKN